MARLVSLYESETMRPFLLFAFSIFVGVSPLANAEPPDDGGKLFVEAYVKEQQGEKSEQAGNLDIALSKLQEAARMLDELSTKFPHWSPTIVKYRKARIAAAIARVQENIDGPAPRHEDKPPDAVRSPEPAGPAPK